MVIILRIIVCLLLLPFSAHGLHHAPTIPEKISIILTNSDSFPVTVTVRTKLGSNSWRLPPYGNKPLLLAVPRTARITLDSKTLGTLTLPLRSSAGKDLCFRIHATPDPNKPGTLMLAATICGNS